MLQYLFRGARFSPKNLRGDLFGGVTTAIVSLPLALTFGVASGAGPVAGLWGATLVGLFAALFGGTKTLISEPTGPMTVIMTAVLSSLIASNPDKGVAMAFTVVMLAGGFQMLFGFLRLGRYVTLMPYSVVSGFMSGIGVILIVIQLPAFVGVNDVSGSVLSIIQRLPDVLSRINPRELALGVAALAILLFFPKNLKRFAPPPLVALIVVTLASLVWLNDSGVDRIGVIPSGLPSFVIPTFTAEEFTRMLIDASILGLLGCIDTLLTAVISDTLTRTEHDSDREIFGQGVGNVVSGALGGLPGAGATMGTVLNIQSGATTPLAGIIRAGLLLLVVMGAAGLTQNIPLAVLAGIAIKVGLDILDWTFLQRAHRGPRFAAVIMYSVMALTVLVDLIVAVGVGVFVANILTIERLSHVQSEHVRAITDADDAIRLSRAEQQELDQLDGRVLLFYLSGPMIFGVARAVARQHAKINEYEAMVLDLSDTSLMDVSVAMAIENAIRDTQDLGLPVYLVMPKREGREVLDQLDSWANVPQEHRYETRLNALRAANYALPRRA